MAMRLRSFYGDDRLHLVSSCVQIYIAMLHLQSFSSLKSCAPALPFASALGDSSCSGDANGINATLGFFDSIWWLCRDRFTFGRDEMEPFLPPKMEFRMLSIWSEVFLRACSLPAVIGRGLGASCLLCDRATSPLAVEIDAWRGCIGCCLRVFASELCRPKKDNRFLRVVSLGDAESASWSGNARAGIAAGTSAAAIWWVSDRR